MNNVSREYNEMKENIEISEDTAEYTIYGTPAKEYFFKK